MKLKQSIYLQVAIITNLHIEFTLIFLEGFLFCEGTVAIKGDDLILVRL